jgi:hypothetical protein
LLSVSKLNQHRRCFHAFTLSSAKPKKEREIRRKKSAKKAKAPSAKENKREFVLFLPPTVEIRFQSPKPLGRGESKGLE